MNQRDQILESALRVLQNQGPAALTVRNVAAGAGCSTTGVYTYFGAKQGLVDAIFIEAFESADRATFLGSGGLFDACVAYRNWAIEHPTQYLVMFGSAVPEYEPSEAALLRAIQSYEQLLATVRSSAPSTNSVETNNGLAHHLWATLHGYVMLELQSMGAPNGESAEIAYERGARLVVDLIER